MSGSFRPRVLAFTPQSPYPPRQGASLRNYHLLSRLARHAELVLVTFVEPNQPAPMATPLGALCQRIHACPVPRRTWRDRVRGLLASNQPDLALRLHEIGLHRVVEQLARQEPFDVVIVEGLEMAPYMETFLAHCARGSRPRLVYDAHNAEYMLQRRAFENDARDPRRWHAAFYSFIQWRRLQRYEGHVVRLVDQVVAVSEADRKNLQALGTATPVTVVPNGVDVRSYERTGHTSMALPPGSLVFTGKMDYRPNVDAVVWFVERVWPHVLAAVPNAHFYVVGRSPHPRVLRYNEMPGVFVTGEVDDVRPYLWGASVFVAPLRVGGGTRLKLLEAMAARCATVSTTFAVEGLPVQPGVHALLADTAEAFAHAVVTLLGDAALRNRLGEAAHALVRQHYDWEILFPRFLAAVLPQER